MLAQQGELHGLRSPLQAYVGKLLSPPLPCCLDTAAAAGTGGAHIRLKQRDLEGLLCGLHGELELVCPRSGPLAGGLQDCEEAQLYEKLSGQIFTEQCALTAYNT